MPSENLYSLHQLLFKNVLPEHFYLKDELNNNKMNLESNQFPRYIEKNFPFSWNFHLSQMSKRWNLTRVYIVYTSVKKQTLKRAKIFPTQKKLAQEETFAMKLIARHWPRKTLFTTSTTSIKTKFYPQPTQDTISLLFLERNFFPKRKITTKQKQNILIKIKQKYFSVSSCFVLFAVSV